MRSDLRISVRIEDSDDLIADLNQEPSVGLSLACAEELLGD
jgi:hypothetical protein